MPPGFSAGVTSITFQARERPASEPYAMNLSYVAADRPSSSFAMVMTRNAFPGAPILIARERRKQSRLQGVLVNNKIANVASPTGIADALALTEAFGGASGVDPRLLLPISTGVIGWSLPVDAMAAAYPSLWQTGQRENLFPFARAIMTTDAYPKLAGAPLGNGTLVGVAKGAGMIEPNLATMLVFLFTDASFSRSEAQRVLARVSDETFNCISVDSDQSTSDICVLLGSERARRVSGSELEAALRSVCSQLAEAIVRNGEGTRHLIRVQVQGRKNAGEAREIGKAIINSPLVKTAICGNDPNVGRILAAVGDYLGNRGIKADPSKLSIRIGAEIVFAGGSFHLDAEQEQRVSAYLRDAEMEVEGKDHPPHQRIVEIVADFGSGPASAVVMGSDLTHEYISENADYRS